MQHAGFCLVKLNVGGHAAYEDQGQWLVAVYAATVDTVRYLRFECASK